jgi:hypothetical protein
MKFLLLFVLTICGFSVAAQSAQEIAYWHIDARGGYTALASVNSLAIESDIIRSGTVMKNSQRILVQKAMRSDTKVGKKTWIQAFDGIRAWYVHPKDFGGTGQAVRDTVSSFATLLRQTNPFPLLNYASQPYKVTKLADEAVDSLLCHHLQILYDTDNATLDLWISTKDAFVYKMRTVNGDQKELMYFKNYQRVDGIWFPFLMEIENPNSGLISVVTKKIKVNPKLKESFFQIPKK